MIRVATIGSFGKQIIFQTSDKKILTFSNMKRTVSGRWVTHNSIKKKPFSEFEGSGLDKVTLRIQVCASHGIKPRKTIESIEKCIKKGTVEKLTIGGKKIGDNKFKITAMSETWDEVLNNGKLYSATLDLTFEEYCK